jgi:transmembrane sensor
MLNKDLIDKFLRGECSDQERQTVVAYLDEHPKAVDEWLEESEWLHFATEEDLPKSFSQEMYTYIERVALRKPMFTVRRIGLSLVAAASVIVLAIAGYKLFFNEVKVEQQAVIVSLEKLEDNKLTLRVNTTNQRIHLEMEDGSIVELSPKSSIAFNKPFVLNGKRDIYLKGEAYFKVAKNKTKPFTVYSETIATTALGTSFTIRSFKEENFIKVHLHTGKVVVKSAKEDKKWLAKNMFLLPDQILMYDKNTLLASINTLDNSNNLIAVKEAANYKLPNWFMFSNQPMTQVFSQLEEMYGVDIKYNASDVSNMYVIAKFDKTDSINNILETIAKLNGLLVIKQGRTYTITRK